MNDPLAAVEEVAAALEAEAPLEAALESALSKLCDGEPFSGGCVFVVRGDRAECVAAVGPSRSRCLGRILRASEVVVSPGEAATRFPLEWLGDGLGLLELFGSGPNEAAIAAARIASRLFAARLAREQEETFRHYFEKAGVSFAIGRADGTVLRINGEYGKFLGYEPAEVVGRNVRQLVAVEFLSETLKGLRELAEGRVERLELERQYLRKDGSLVWGHAVLTRLGNTGLLIAVVQDVDQARRAEEAVRKLSGRLLQLQDEERRRIARALHESAAQTVAALSMNLQRMERMSLPAHAIETLADSLDLVTQCSREIRTLSHLLHPPLLEEAGLPSSVRWYVQGFASRSNVEVSMDLADDLGRLSTELEITLFRVVQESLTNVHRHASSQKAAIRLRRSGPEVVLEIEDDGIGIATDVLERVRSQSAAAVGVGIAGMRERLSQLGGSLELQSSTRGTLVRARLRSEAGGEGRSAGWSKS
jgi:PAS domain S-box-containing protein